MFPVVDDDDPSLRRLSLEVRGPFLAANRTSAALSESTGTLGRRLPTEWTREGARCHWNCDTTYAIFQRTA